MKSNIKEASVDLISLNLKKTLAKDGYLLCRENPFLNWIRHEEVTACRPEKLGLNFYIASPPVPPVSPFDLATVFISFEPPPSGHIFVQLTFHFHTVLEPCIEADEIYAVYDKHNAIWFPNLAEYFTEIENSFNFSWDTEYDESIEDNLSIHMPLEKVDNIPTIMKSLKLQYEQWCQQERKIHGQ